MASSAVNCTYAFVIVAPGGTFTPAKRIPMTDIKVLPASFIRSRSLLFSTMLPFSFCSASSLPVATGTSRLPVFATTTLTSPEVVVARRVGGPGRQGPGPVRARAEFQDTLQPSAPFASVPMLVPSRKNWTDAVRIAGGRGDGGRAATVEPSVGATIDTVGPVRSRVTVREALVVVCPLVSVATAVIA